MSEKEFRKIVVDELRVENSESEDKPTIIEGYINKFDERSEFMGFYETVKRNAFDNTLNSDDSIIALFDHDTSKILGSTKSGSLKLHKDEIGLRFELQPNLNVSYANDVAELVRSGDLNGCSFGMIVNEDDWTTNEEGIDERQILDVDLVEVTLTAFPAYQSSEASVRSHENYKEEMEQRKQRQLDKEKLLIELDL